MVNRGKVVSCRIPMWVWEHIAMEAEEDPPNKEDQGSTISSVLNFYIMEGLKTTGVINETFDDTVARRKKRMACVILPVEIMQTFVNEAEKQGTTANKLLADYFCDLANTGFICKEEFVVGKEDNKVKITLSSSELNLLKRLMIRGIIKGTK